MRIEFEEVNIKLKQDEVWDLMFCVNHSILDTLKSHWRTLINDQSLKQFIEYVHEQEKKRICLLESFSNILDRRDLMESLDYEIKQVWDNYQKSETKLGDKVKIE